MPPRTAPETIPTPWQGPRLLVPVAVNLMLQTPITAPDQPTATSTVNYTDMTQFADPGPTPFGVGGESSAFNPGATISWVLPSALTRAAAPAHTFPPVPNRWLVVRTILTDAPPAYTAWVVESDYSSPGQGPGTNRFPTGIGPSDKVNLAWFGRALPLGQWPASDDPGPMQPPLSAVGPGDPSLAAFVPGMFNVFSFVDGLADVTSAATLTYWVAGWYAQPKLDPLYCDSSTGWQTEAEWRKLMQQLGWSVGNDDALAAAVATAQAWSRAKGLSVPGTGDQQLYPAQILCHGMTYQVAWPGPTAGLLPNSIPVNPVVTIGVGRTTAEAFGAMVAWQIDNPGQRDGQAEQPVALAADREALQPPAPPSKGTQVAEMIEAFQYHLLDTFDTTGSASLARSVHDGGFASHKGGTLWKLKPAEGQGHAPLAAGLAPALAALNAAQFDCDVAERRLAGAQRELYTAWYRYSAADPDFPPPNFQQLQQYLSTQQNNVTQLQAPLPSLQAKVTAAQDALNALLPPKNGKVPRPTLHATPAEPYASPLDPVVAISGVGRAFKFGEDAGLSPHQTLFCRFSGQTMTGIEVAVSATLNEAVSGRSLAAAFPANAKLPLDVADLAAECVLLDTGAAGSIAAAARAAAGTGATYSQAQVTSEVTNQQTIVWNGTGHAILAQALADAGGFVGTVPNSISVTLWKNAWVPLYLDWEVSWTQYDPSQWVFDGEDFQLATKATPATTPSFQGRVVLTPNAGNDLYQTIQSYAKHDANAQTLFAAIQHLPDIDVLSQRLSGLGHFLQTLEINKASFQPKSISHLLGDARGLIPTSSDFYPVAGGRMEITRLWVVDAFGQALPIIDSNSAPSVVRVNYAPTIAGTPQTPQAFATGLLPPRVIQPTRLEFDLIDATDQTSIVAQDPAANPICGWLLPNHLDQGVTVYDQDGCSIGEVVIAGDASNQTLLWRPSPGNLEGLGQPPNIGNIQLAALVGTYLNAPDGAKRLIRLLTVIDETLSTFHPPVAHGAITSMAAAIGNPVAVVSARVTLRLDGDPALSQVSADTGEDLIGNAATFQVPFQLGSLALPDDGLLGYFLNADYDTLLTLAGEETEPANAAQFTLPLLTPARGAPSATLLLLMDPRGKVHAATGCLPVVEVELPGADVGRALDNMAVTFEAGPVLTDLPNVRVPIPALGVGSWKWLDRPTPATLAAPLALTAANPKPRLPADPLAAVEGWLQLSGAVGGEEQK